MAALDFYIGEPDCIGMGLGAEILKGFLENHIFPYFDACLVDPEKKNKIAVKTYAKAGFSTVHEWDTGIGELGEEDGSIPTAMPDLSTRSIEVHKPQEEPPKAIEQEKTEGYEEFCQKHLCEDEKVAYVRKIAQATNKTEAQIINSAVSNEAGFLTAFNKWKADQQNVEKRAKHKGGAPLPAQTNSAESLVASA